MPPRLTFFHECWELTQVLRLAVLTLYGLSHLPSSTTAWWQWFFKKGPQGCCSLCPCALPDLYMFSVWSRKIGLIFPWSETVFPSHIPNATKGESDGATGCFWEVSHLPWKEVMLSKAELNQPKFNLVKKWSQTYSIFPKHLAKAKAQTWKEFFCTLWSFLKMWACVKTSPESSSNWKRVMSSNLCHWQRQSEYQPLLDMSQPSKKRLQTVLHSDNSSA